MNILRLFDGIEVARNICSREDTVDAFPCADVSVDFERTVPPV